MSDLWQRRIVREQGEETLATYYFNHDKLREHVYASLSFSTPTPPASSCGKGI